MATAAKAKMSPTKPLDILYAGMLPPHHGGAALSAWQLVSQIARCGHSIRAISPLRAGASDHLPGRKGEQLQLTVERFTVPFDFIGPNNPPPPGYWELEQREVQSRLASQITARRPDLLLLGRESFALHAIPVAVAHKLPVVVRIGGGQTAAVSKGAFTEAFRRDFRATLASADLLCPQAGHMAGILRGLGMERIRTISNLVDLELFRPQPPNPELRSRLRIPENHLVALHLSNFKSIKRVLDIVASAPLVLERNPEITYVICGDGPERQTAKDLCRRNGTSGSFRFVDWLEYEEVPAYLNLADIVIMPSEMEHQARIYLESQACERLLLASDVDGAREVVTHGETGLLFRMGDVEDLADKTLLAASDPAFRTAAGRRAGVRVRRHDLKHVAKDYISAMMDVLDSRTREPAPLFCADHL